MEGSFVPTIPSAVFMTSFRAFLSAHEVFPYQIVVSAVRRLSISTLTWVRGLVQVSFSTFLRLYFFLNVAGVLFFFSGETQMLVVLFLNIVAGLRWAFQTCLEPFNMVVFQMWEETAKRKAMHVQ